jgi:hypothetical protein
LPAIIQLLLLALIFRQPDARDLRMAIRHARHVVVLDRVRLLPGDDLGDDDPFAAALVRQHGWAGDVADRVIAGRARLEALVDLDEAAVGELNAAFLEADVLGVHRAARRHQDGWLP